MKHLTSIYLICLTSLGYAQLLNDPVNEPPSTVLNFYENQGQVVDDSLDPVDSVKYYNKRMGTYFMNGAVAFVYNDFKDVEGNVIDRYRLDLIFDFEMASPPTTSWESGSYHNYYLGYLQSPVTGVQGHKTVSYEDVRNGISLHFHTNERGLKTYIEVDPGARLDQLKFVLDGQDSLEVDSLQITAYMEQEKITFTTGYAYEIDGSGNSELLPWVPVFENTGNGTFKIDPGNYNISNKLVIVIPPPPPNPPSAAQSNYKLDWSTYIGHGNSDQAVEMAILPSGEYFVCGNTNSPLFPEAAGSIVSFTGFNNSGHTDCYIQKFHSSNQVVWTSFLGGSTTDYARDIATDGDWVYVTGATQSGDFRKVGSTVPHQGSWDGFYCRFHKDEDTLTFSELFGGSTQDEPFGMDVDDNGNVVIVGLTNSTTSFPWTDPGNGAYYQNSPAGGEDGFIVRYNSSDSITWGTYFGTQMEDQIWDVKTGPNDEVRVVGTTTQDYYSSTCSPPTNGSFPICVDTAIGEYFQEFGTWGLRSSFFAEFSNAGELEWSTYLGSPNGRDGKFNSLSGHAKATYYVGGTSKDMNTFPADGTGYTFNGRNHPEEEVFIYKFTGRGLDWSLVYGTNDCPTHLFGIEQDNADNVFIGGVTKCDSLPPGSSFCQPPGYSDTWYPVCNDFGIYLQEDGPNQPVNNGGTDESFLAGFDSDGDIFWSTFFGGNGTNPVTTLYRHEHLKPRMYNSGAYLYFLGHSPTSNISTFIHTEKNSDSAYFQPFPGGGIRDGVMGRFEFGAYLGAKDEDGAVNISEEPGFRIFPNPVTGRLQIELTNTEENAYLEVMNAGGSVVYSKQMNSNRDQVDMTGLPPGIYLVRISNKGINETRKVIKK